MKQFVLTCCSTCDLPAALLAERDISYACFHFTLNGQEHPDDLGVSIPFEQFYQAIADGAEPTTSQVSTGQYLELWEPFLAAGQDVLHITLSSGLSGTYNSACAARATLMEKYPERKLYLVDSLGASSGYGLLVTTAADKRDSGESIEAVRDWLEANKLRLHHWFFSTDLTSYVRGGRISRTAAIFGTMLKICPLLNMNTEGKLIPREKIRTKKAVINTIVERMAEHAQDGLNYSGKCYISNSACMEDARVVAEQVEARFPKLNGKVLINSVGTVIGSHTGPGTVALFFYGDDRVL